MFFNLLVVKTNIYLAFAESEVAAAQITTPKAILLTKSARL